MEDRCKRQTSWLETSADTQGPVLGEALSSVQCTVVTILTFLIILNKATHFHLALGSANYASGPGEVLRASAHLHLAIQFTEASTQLRVVGLFTLSDSLSSYILLRFYKVGSPRSLTLENQSIQWLCPARLVSRW
jgi:hypothetical protein